MAKYLILQATKLASFCAQESSFALERNLVPNGEGES